MKEFGYYFAKARENLFSLAGLAVIVGGVFYCNKVSKLDFSACDAPIRACSQIIPYVAGLPQTTSPTVRAVYDQPSGLEIKNNSVFPIPEKSSKKSLTDPKDWPL